MVAKQKKYQNKKIILLAVAVVIAIVLTVGSLIVYRNFQKPKPDFNGTAGLSGINYSPPTQDERRAANEQKEKNVTEQANASKNEDNKAIVVITDASYYADNNSVEVRAYISNIIEDGGTCTVTFEKDGHKITQQQTAFKDATTTQCGALDTPRSQFNSNGTWNTTVVYTSSKANGQQTTSLKL